MQEIKENISKYECNETETDANRTDTHTRLSGSIKCFFSKFIIVNLKRKRVSMSEASHLSKFKMVWIWSARQFKQNGPL